MNRRERLKMALNHQQPDRPPLDLGSTAVTGAHVSIVHQLREAFGLPTEGDRRVKITEPYQMLGRVEPDLMEILGVDCIGLGLSRTMLGWKNEGWKPWVTLQGIPCQVPAAFNTQPEPDGSLLQWCDGDRAYEPNAVMPAGGYFFDTLVRQPPINEATLVEDNLEEFTAISDEELERLRRLADDLYSHTPYGLVATFGGTAFGDIALVPAPFLKAPKGIRDIAEWYMSTVTRRDVVYEIFDRQCEIALKNLELIRQAVGDRVEAVFVTGTDFGTQNGPFISPDAYRDLFQPFHRRVNDWMHRHTSWKSFIHSCGSIAALIPDFIDSGFDILNPVQCTAACMDAQELKRRFGDKLVFWGGAIDTQTALPFGTPEQVYEQARERIRIFGADGGFVFNAVHNIQGNAPIENVLAFYRALRDEQENPGK